MKQQQWRRWLAWGTGAGIEIHGRDLRLTVVRVRPQGAEILGVAHVPDFEERPAAEWGAECAQFLKKTGAGHVAVNVLLPRDAVTVRVVALPGVKDEDLAAALTYELEGLHPYAEEDATYAYARLGQSPHVLVGVAERSVVDRYALLFTEAGLKVAAFTFSAAVLHPAARLLHDAPAPFLAVNEQPGAVEVYGESEARPVYSAVFDPEASWAVHRATSELRLPPETEAVPLIAILPKPRLAPQDYDLAQAALPYAAALSSACPRLFLPVNLLPAEYRTASSRLMYVPVAATGALALLLGAAALAQPAFENRKYVQLVDQEIKRFEPEARQVRRLEQDMKARQERIRLLDQFRQRSQQDLELLQEMTRILPPPNWLNSVEINRREVVAGGYGEQPASFLQLFDKSPLLVNSEFVSPIMRSSTYPSMEQFRLRAQREEGK